MASRFVSENELKQIDLGEGDWVKVPSRLSYEMVEGIAELKTEKEKNISLLVKIIREWNLTDDNGNIVPISIDNIRRLELATVNIISTSVAELMGNEKKVSMG